jgi:hypothetical protein
MPETSPSVTNEPLPMQGKVMNTVKGPDGQVTYKFENPKIHGNSLKSERPTWGYKLYKEDGTFLKNGITSKPIPETRYTRSFMMDKNMPIKIQFPNRAAAYEWEFQQNLIQRGPLNFNMH